MSAILDIPEVRERVSRLSVREYHQLGEFNENGKRTELIRGIVIEKVSKSPLHSIVSSLLYDLLARLLPRGYSIWKEEPLTFLDSEPEPDISITAGEKTDYTTEHPTTAELAVEVAVHSAALDRENASMYAEAGVKEYWIVLPHDSRIEVYLAPKDGRYTQHRLFSSSDTLQCVSVPALRFLVSDVFPATGVARRSK